MTAAAPILPERETTHRGIVSWRWLWTLPILLALAVAGFAILRPIQVLPRITLAPGYALTNQNGDLLTSEAMRGKIVLYSFTYTRCNAPCAQATKLWHDVQQRLPQLDRGAVPIEFVTISIDPAHDSPEVLSRYAAELGADTAVWHFATADPQRLKWIVGSGFGLFFAPQEDGSFTLDQGYMLVDGAGILRAEYRYLNPGADIILRDLGLLLKEAQHSSGAARYAYEAAHLFACYPR